MTKFYKVKKDTFMWDEGAIISNEGDSNEYRAITDLWNHTDLKNEYISAHIVESADNADFFERAYRVSVLKQAKYLTKEAAKTLQAELYKSPKA